MAYRNLCQIFRHSYKNINSTYKKFSNPNTQVKFNIRYLALYKNKNLNAWRCFSTSNIYSSSTPSVPQAVSGTYLPPPPSITPQLEEVVTQQLNSLGEPTLSSLGLATWYPNGLVQWALENIHVGLDVPWWGAIAIGTLCLRVLTFPIVVVSQRNAANMHNHMPTIQKLQEKFQKVKNTGNILDTARHGSTLHSYMQKHKVNPVKNMLVPMVQLPIFLSVFMGLRQMANLPVESMTSAGLFWFTDLTSPDPFYALPLLTMATFALSVELGVDGVRAASMSTNMRMFMRVFPLIVFPFTLNFPAALLVYWLCSNTISLVQVAALRHPSVKEALKIPQMVKHEKKEKKSFVENIKETWRSSKGVVNVEEMQKREAVRFKEAGMGAIVKTYDYDPTKKKKKK